ncbi:hypothetical protein SAMN05421678_12729 [Actinopolymorpha cephalotaxi]|uniref:PH domain-containing protein n=1 Tax=Actinopolymorpha cephalotaxi TaxID=504797 RepID=A0A1I3BXJ0_9ACTN|nr:hypothetical protein [Actinopolymorpha cephalotaxi]SFH66461.1 hypothetical protein SAMN05421678_12729 [Actinopolymorpha cephalotaxi]
MRGMALVLRPLAANRLANGLPGLCVVGVAVGVFVEFGSTPLGLIIATACASGGLLLAVRGYRSGVLCDRGTATVRGLLRTRTIARSHIVEVTDFPAIRWRTEAGRPRWTPIIALMADNRELAYFRNHKLRSLSQLRRWARRRR